MPEPTTNCRALNVILILVGVWIVVAAGIGLAYRADTSGQPTTIRGLVIEGPLIGRVPAGNLERQEITEVVDGVAGSIGEIEIPIRLPDRTERISAAEAGVSIDTAELVDRALRTGNEGPLLDRIWTWIGSFTTSRPVSTNLTFDRDQAAETVAEFGRLVVAEPVEPRLALDPDQALIAVEGSNGEMIDVNGVVSELASRVATKGPFEVVAPTIETFPAIDIEDVEELARKLNVLTASGVTLQLGEEQREVSADALRLRLNVGSTDGVTLPSFDAASLQRLIVESFSDVVDPGEDPTFDIVNGEPAVLEEGSVPTECCADNAAEMVQTAIFGEGAGPVILDPRPVQDPGVAAWASGEQIVELVSEFTTNHQCCQDRVRNIQRFADIVRGTYLTPGESLSLNEHVGERTAARGFVPAGTIIRGRLVPTVGGGVSQFATTIFNAAFFAGFDFETYQSHSLYFSRYPYGREATVSWPLPDLEFTNTTGYPALIWTSYSPTSITVSVYSTKSVEVEQIGQEESMVRQCTRVDTFRRRTYEDGRSAEDSVLATYRPGEGLDCDGNPTSPVDP